MLFKLGRERVKETPNYEHVGVKVCAKDGFHVRTEETVTKAQRVLDMAAPVGIAKSGFSMYICCLVYG